MLNLNSLTTTDFISLIGIIASLLTSIIAIIISIRTLKQNSKTIETSTRPYIVVYSKVTNFQSPMYYIIVKNFGKSGAYINSFDYDYDLTTYSFTKEVKPFCHLAGTFIAPGQSYIYPFDNINLFKNPQIINFSVSYKNGRRNYIEQFPINLQADSGLLLPRANTDGKILQNISFTLQDLVEKQL